MAVDLTNRRLFIDKTDPDNPIGITPQEVSLCLQDYRVDTNGNVDVGMMCTSEKVNKWAADKPFPDEAWSYETVEEKEAARKAASQGLIVPTAYVSGVSTTDTPTMQTYLGTIVVKAIAGIAPNWEYDRPKGFLYNEPFRLDDFDGYKHLASDGSRQPYETAIRTLDKSKGLGTDIISVNRFVTPTLTCVFADRISDLKLSDIIQNMDYLHFCVEGYDANNPSGIDTRDPNELFVYPDPISGLGDGDWQEITLDLATLSQKFNGRYIFVLGVNRFSQGTDNAPDSNGQGFIEPWQGDQFPIYNIKIDYYGVLAFKQLEGFYYKAGPTLATFDLHDYDRFTYEKNYSDIVGLSLSIKQRGENFFITGSNPQGVPSGRKTFQFRLVNPTANRSIVGIVSDATMASGTVTSIRQIAMGDEWETVYLKFPRFILKGEKVDSAILEISADGGNSWTMVDPSATADEYGFEFATDCDGSSVKLMLEGTIE